MGEKRKEKKGSSSSVLRRVGQALWWKFPLRRKETFSLSFSSHRYRDHPNFPSAFVFLCFFFFSRRDCWHSLLLWRTCSAIGEGGEVSEKVGDNSKWWTADIQLVQSTINGRRINFNIRDLLGALKPWCSEPKTALMYTPQWDSAVKVWVCVCVRARLNFKCEH